MCQYRPYLLGVHTDQKSEPEVEVLLHGKELGPNGSVEKYVGVDLRAEIHLVGASRSYGVGRFVDEPEQPGTIGLRHLYSVGIVVPMAGKQIICKVESEREGKEKDAHGKTEDHGDNGARMGFTDSGQDEGICPSRGSKVDADEK